MIYQNYISKQANLPVSKADMFFLSITVVSQWIRRVFVVGFLDEAIVERIEDYGFGQWRLGRKNSSKTGWLGYRRDYTTQI